ncbi:MAG TPA: N-acetylneuraminate synthase family protein [Bacteroidia bacterium]|jgi:sialic acid synthase SpsE|nr:N-acetylneuraminate synthase family protein [Bacteroidia bacterium]
MRSNIQTSFFSIGNENPCYIIAEIGSNHNGNFDMACEMIEKAKDAGVNAVKFQTFKAKEHYSKKTPKIDLYKEDIYTLIEKLEIDRTWHTKLAALCKKLAIDFLDSPCDTEAIQIAVNVGMPIIKIASYDMVDIRLVDQIAKTGKAVMFSTGMSTTSEIETAVNICRTNNNNNIIVLQCTSLYPAPAHLSNLNAMLTIANMFGVITGYSDHTLGDHIPCAAIALGAKVIEKHYTLNRQLPGPDHNFAIEPHELKDMVNKMRDIESALGDGIKNGPRGEEMDLFAKARRSIIAKQKINKGQVIKSNDIVIKRPGLGIHPSQIHSVIGRIAQRDIEEDEPITPEMI